MEASQKVKQQRSICEFLFCFKNELEVLYDIGPADMHETQRAAPARNKLCGYWCRTSISEKASLSD